MNMDIKLTGSAPPEERMLIIDEIVAELTTDEKVREAVTHHVRHIAQQYYFRGLKDGQKRKSQEIKRTDPKEFFIGYDPQKGARHE